MPIGSIQYTFPKKGRAVISPKKGMNKLPAILHANLKFNPFSIWIEKKLSPMCVDSKIKIVHQTTKKQSLTIENFEDEASKF